MSGYSLIELMIVLILLAVMATMAWPMLQKPLARIRLKSIANKVVQDVATRRLEAMQDGEAKELSILVPDGVEYYCSDIVCYPDGSCDRGVITLQQDKLKVDIKIDGLTESAKVGDCYYGRSDIQVSERQSESNSDELSE